VLVSQELVPRSPIPLPLCKHNLAGMPEGWRMTEVKMSKAKKRFHTEQLTEVMIARKWETTVEMFEERKAEYYESLRMYGGEGFFITWCHQRQGRTCWSKATDQFGISFNMERVKCTQFQLQLRLLRAAGFSMRAKHPMRIQLRYVHEEMRRSRETARSRVWIQRNSDGPSFVLATNKQTV
jgi:hypothetical protein